MEELEKYRQMLRELADIRHRHKFNDSEEEDAFLDRMDEQWKKLSNLEIQTIREMWPAFPLMDK